MDIGERLQLFPLLRIAAMLMLGIIAGNSIGNGVPTDVWIISALSVGIISLFLNKKPYLQGAMLMLATFLIGAYNITNYKNANTVILPEGYHEYKAVVAGKPQVRGKVIRCDLIITSGYLAGSKVKASILRDTVEKRSDKLRIGDGIMAYSRLERPTNFYKNSNFDYKLWLEIHGFKAQTFIYYQNWIGISPETENLPIIEKAKLKAALFREQILSQFQAVSGDNEALAVASAMSLGDKSALTKDLKEAYSVTGASHVLALSGLHLGIIYFVLSLLFVHRRWYAAGQLAIVAALWAYAVMTGLSPSVTRSASMFSLYALVGALNRDKLSLNTLSFAAIAMLSANPIQLWDIGFQMSFMAVLGITIFYSPINHIVKGSTLAKSWVFRAFWSMISVSAAAQITVSPLVMYYFGRYSCYSLFTNIIAVPLTTCVIYCALLTILSIPLQPLQTFFGNAMSSTAQLLNESIRSLASLPGASIDNIRVNTFQVVMMYALMGCLYIIGIYLVKMYRATHGYTLK